MFRSLPGFPNRGTVTRFAVAVPALAPALVLALALAAGEGRADEPGLPRSGAATSESADEIDPVRLIREALDRAERWNDLGEPDKALLLLHDVMDAARFHGVDTLAIRFAMAQAHLRLRRYEEAASILRELVRERPSIHRFQLDYAAALFALGRNEEARKIFLEVRRNPDLPSAVRRNVERFLQQILSQQRFRVDLDWGFWRDDNVNNAPEIETVTIPVLGQRLIFELHEQPVSAWIARTGVRVRWREPITKDRRGDIVTSASAARNTVLGASEHNRSWARLSVEPRLRYKADIAGWPRSGLVRTQFGIERRWRDGIAYATSLWTGFGVDQTLSDDWVAGVFTRLWTTGYDGRSAEVEPRGRSVSPYVRRGIGPGWLTVGGQLSREDPEARTLRWTSGTGSLAYAADFGRGWSVSVRANLARTRFDHEHSTFLVRREDVTRRVGLVVSNRALGWGGYLPELVLSWQRTTSTIPLYERELGTAQARLRRLF